MLMNYPGVPRNESSGNRIAVATSELVRNLFQTGANDRPRSYSEILNAEFAPESYSRIMSSQRLEDLKTGLVKDFEAHKQHISHEGLFRCTLCEMYQKELSRLEGADQRR